MNDIYEMILAYDGPEQPNVLEKIILQRKFMAWREPYVDIFNNNIEKWNDEFDRIHPGVVLSGNGSELTKEDRLYGSFLKKKAAPLFNKVYQPLIKFEVNDGIAVNDCVGDLIGRFKHKDCIVHMYLRKVEA